jgi:Restriction endonuclease/Novel STAND NTPase 1
MKIEVASPTGAPNKEKGDLLENISKDLLEALGYDVIEEIRFTGVELDLLCKHKVNNKEIYVECKAQKEKIGAPILRQLIGTVVSYNYSEGWLVTTSDFGKEAKGFIEMWKGKPSNESSKLSFYSPVNIIEALQRASVICSQPNGKAEDQIGGAEFLGEWTLLLTSYGKFWAVYTLQGGAPHGVLLFNATNGRQIQDDETLNNISQLETNLAEYDLKIGVQDLEDKKPSFTSTPPSVVEVQIGDSWDDYRPARPQDFVGRDEAQKELISFLKNANEKKSDTRIFAITGNSGLGKSSLIAKVRDRTRNKFYKKRYFTFAVDIRGAKTPSYISSALLKCFQQAQQSGFGDPVDLQLTDPSSPLTSQSIARYLDTVERKGQVICLIFDQFEELYSNPELFGVFKTAKDLMLDVASYKGNFVLGFAWKTDSTTQQDHPAYHMWHELADHRRVYKLDVFDKGEISKSITTFEKDVQQKLPIEIRHQIMHSSQGFPWLLKKLCINLYENLKKGEGAESILLDLDVRRLFENDLELLTPTEHTCLKIIAQKAPADWSEIIEISGIAVLNALVHKRLVIKSGDRLNIYWDIFKDYLLSGKVPIVPFNYIPTSDYYSMLKVFQTLNSHEYIGAEEIAITASLNEKTVGNIGADLVMFSLAERKGTNFKCHRDLVEFTEISVLNKLREKLGKHSLKLAIYKEKAGKTIDQSAITTTLRRCLPKAKFSNKTWTTYANRLSNLFTHTGYFVRVGSQIVVQDLGTPITDTQSYARKGKKRGVVFSAPASPASVYETLKLLESNDDHKSLLAMGYRNSLTVLKRFELVLIADDKISINLPSIEKYGGYKEAVWTSAKNEPVIVKCLEKITQDSSISGFKLGEYISVEYNNKWTTSSMQRNGHSLKQWSAWIKEGIAKSQIPTPPGRVK